MYRVRPWHWTYRYLQTIQSLKITECLSCATTDPEIFFPEKGAKGQSLYIVQAARRMCAGCPYKEPCLAWAVEHDEMGIWGGTTAKERRVHRRATQKSLGVKSDRIVKLSWER
jgi:WhiB family transcriptional regulator, redox-sensing transcriptional regulator